MAKRAYISKTFSAANQAILDHCLDAIDEYRDQGFKMSLRQLYYVLVSDDLIPNDDKQYKRLGRILSDARLAGMVDWDAIEDRNRTPVTPNEFKSLRHLVRSAIEAYRLPRCAGQDTYVELWVEKAALANVLEPLAMEHHATLMVNRGYSSQSAMMESAERIDEACRFQSPDGSYHHSEGYPNKNAVILYLGDLDPSGEDMVRDIEDRLYRFLAGGDTGQEYGQSESPSGWNTDAVGVVELTVEKIAITMDQVEEHGPPPNPAKKSDARAKAFIEQYGASSWEVDALRPPILQKIIREAFAKHLNLTLMQEVKAQEQLDIERLRSVIEDVR